MYVGDGGIVEMKMMITVIQRKPPSLIEMVGVLWKKKRKRVYYHHHRDRDHGMKQH